MVDRIDSASRIIRATPQAIYRAHLDRDAIAAWRPPEGMRAEIYAFEPREGGSYRMAFIYLDPGSGKTTADADLFEGRFVELIPDQRIIEQVSFQSDDPAYGGAMTIVTSLTPVEDGTRVLVEISDVPPGISPEDHQVGMDSSLSGLAAFVER